jgi:DNA-binding ferritin-like protein (Dps family)
MNLQQSILRILRESTEITEKCWKGYTQKGMKTMFGKRYPNCVKKKKKESKEGVGGYAAPAFEMKPDHVHFKHLYNESELPIQVIRRYKQIEKLLNTLLSNMYPYDYDNEDHFFDGVIHELYFLAENEDFGLNNIEWEDIYEYISQYKRDDINEYYREHQKNNMNESIRRIIREEVQKKYPKPNEKLDRLIYKWLNDYFEGSQIYQDEVWKNHRFDFLFCKDGREIGELEVEFEDNSEDWGPQDERPMGERRFTEARFRIYPGMISDILGDIPIRKNYLNYLIEEWFEDTYLDKIQGMLGRNDLSLDSVDQYSQTQGDVCVPPISKPEDVTMQDMMDYIKKRTLFTYDNMEKYENNEAGWTEKLYLKLLRNDEQRRLSGID